MTRFVHKLMLGSVVVALQLSSLALTSCAPMASALSSPTFDDISSILDQSLVAEKEGQIEKAIGFARSATDDPRVQSFPVVRSQALQRLGLSLCKAGQLDEAEKVAREMDTLATNVRGMPVHAAIAYARCDFAEAASLQLRMREASPSGTNDRATEVNLAVIDEAEGRFLRAFERLQYVAKTKPKTSTKTAAEADSMLESEIAMVTARIRSRLGDHEALAEIMARQMGVDPLEAADRYAEHALQSHKGLFQAYHTLVGGLLSAEAIRAPAPSIATSQQELQKVLESYRETPSPCRKVVPDPTMMEAPANRSQLFPWLQKDPNAEADAEKQAQANKTATGYLAGREIHLNQQIPFDYNSADIKPDGNAVLDWLATFLKEHPELGTVFIEGHTDDQGTDQYNLDLSNRRAKAVVAALVARVVPAARLVAKGYGKTQPKIIGSDEASRAANRRVEILVSGVALQSSADGSSPK